MLCCISKRLNYVLQYIDISGFAANTKTKICNINYNAIYYTNNSYPRFPVSEIMKSIKQWTVGKRINFIINSAR